MAPFALIAPLLAWVWWVQVGDMGLRYASYGLGPMGYVYKAADPEGFARDFPNSTEEFDKSAVMQVYPLAYRWLGVEPERLVPVMMAVEILLVATVMVALTRTLRPEAPPAVAALAVLLAVASGARDMNLAGFKQPFFWGLYYNVTDALRLLAFVLVVKGRVVSAAVLLAGAFACHPAMGLMGAGFAFAPLLLRPRELTRRRNVAAGLLFVGLAGAWLVGVIGLRGLTGGDFPTQLWLDLTRTFGFHWYPVQNGIFTAHHDEAFLPFLSFLAIAAFYLTRPPVGEPARKAAASIVAALGMVALGVAFSAVPVSPALIKLSLHRANDMVLTVGLVYVAAGLWGELGSGAAWRKVTAAVLLASPFVAPPGFPLVFAVALVAPAVARSARPTVAAGDRAVAAVVLAAALTVAGAASSGSAASPLSGAYTGLEWLRGAPALVGLGVLAVGLAFRGLPRGIVLAAAVLGAAAFTETMRTPEEDRASDRDFKAAQEWARANTPRDALFFVDPTLYYGWRDYSRRSSFGNLREWLYLAWAYNSDHALCREGMRRVGEFGFKVEDYFGREPPFEGFRALSRELRRRVYIASDAARLALARRYGISYFVFRKLRDFPGLPRTRLPVAHENEHFVILRAQPGS
ncbi:MAG: hypothetical protein FJ291_29315 [Planctomycetes bacterium]|nr:hypothetical protein [Planctomycetota bacterium]